MSVADRREPTPCCKVSPAAAVRGVSPLLLDRFSRFFGMAAGDLKRLAAATECQLVPAGNVVFCQGDAGDAVYLVLDGTVRLERADAGGLGYAHEVHGPAGIFGDIVLLGIPERHYTAVAATAAVLLRVPADVLNEVLGLYRDIATAWTCDVSAQLEYRRERLGATRLDRLASGFAAFFDAA